MDLPLDFAAPRGTLMRVLHRSPLCISSWGDPYEDALVWCNGMPHVSSWIWLWPVVCVNTLRLHRPQIRHHCVASEAKRAPKNLSPRIDVHSRVVVRKA